MVIWYPTLPSEIFERRGRILSLDQQLVDRIQSTRLNITNLVITQKMVRHRFALSLLVKCGCCLMGRDGIPSEFQAPWESLARNSLTSKSKSSTFASISTMSNDSNQTTLATLDSLEGRLRKVEWYLSGSDNVADTLQQVASQGQDKTVQARLARLENNLQNLSASSPEVNELVKLRQSSSQMMLRLLY